MALGPFNASVMSSAEVLLCVCCISVGGLHFIALCVFCLKLAWRCRTLLALTLSLWFWHGFVFADIKRVQGVTDSTGSGVQRI